MTPSQTTPTLAYDVAGDGQAIVFIHGLTFSAATWRPIVELLAPRFRCITVDLPGHGRSLGPIPALQEVGERLHETVNALEVEAPVVLGHSLGALMATFYAATFPASGVVNVDQPLLVAPFARAMQQLAPALRSPAFCEVFAPIHRGIGVEQLPEPLRSEIASTQSVSQDLVLGYWNEMLSTPVEELQAQVNAAVSDIKVPYLLVMDTISSADRDYVDTHLPKVHVEELHGGGHMAHLTQAQRFTAQVASFVRECYAD